MPFDCDFFYKFVESKAVELLRGLQAALTHYII